MQPRLLPYSPERDVYRLLQVEPTADPDEIGAALRRLARTFHPDRNGSPRATQEMQVVNAVRDLLVDPQARAAYDRARGRFLAESAAPLPPVPRVLPPAPRAAPLPPIAPRTSRLALTARAVLSGLRATLEAFGPPRCGACRELVEADYRYCGACGAPLRSPEALTGR